MTAACGFGYQGQCCCECALHLVARPKCHHLGGPRQCGTEPEPEEKTGYVCLAFADEGVAQTNWDKHGSCEMWTPKKAVCVSEGCSNEASYVSPASYCVECWLKWWNCENCVPAEDESDTKDCELHTRETNN